MQDHFGLYPVVLKVYAVANTESPGEYWHSYWQSRPYPKFYNTVGQAKGMCTRVCSKREKAKVVVFKLTAPEDYNGR